MIGKTLSRRGFLGVAVAVPAVAAVGCGSSESSAAAEDATSDVTTDESASDTGTSEAAPTDVASDVAVETDAETHVCAESLPRIDLKIDCGAKGDGKSDDTVAFQTAASKLSKGGELFIPPGVYIVGKQDHAAGSVLWKAQEIFSLTGVPCLKISGYGAVIRLADGLLYGGFDSSGSPKDYLMGTADKNKNGADVGHMIELQRCQNVLIEGVELDGNNEKLKLGGQWGDVDRQNAGGGIWVNECDDVNIVDVHTHHHALDGITVLYLSKGLTAKKPHKLSRVVSEYNGRQGLSWIGGWGLECVDCKFNHTGRAMNGGAPLKSLPRAGLDIEPNALSTGQLTRDGVFTRCEFYDNAGPGIVTATGDAGYATFDDCTIWGTTTFSIYIVHPGVKFTKCKIFGTAVHGSNGHKPGTATAVPELATKFEDCTFEDKPDGTSYSNGQLYDLNEGCAGVTFTRCTFINHKGRAVLMGDTTEIEIFDSCTFVFSNATLSSGTHQAEFNGVRLKSCRFEESSEVSSSGKKYPIKYSAVTVDPPDAGAMPTHVDGPAVSFAGKTGDIDPKTYP